MQSSGGKKKDARSVIEGVKRQSAARAKKEDQKRLIYAGLGLIAIIVLVIIIAVASSGKKADETLAEPSASPTARSGTIVRLLASMKGAASVHCTGFPPTVTLTAAGPGAAGAL